MPTGKCGGLTKINLVNFRAWAYEHPLCLAGIDSDRLNWLMEDKDFCDKVEAMQRPRIGIPQPVIRLSDGSRFASLKAAAREVYVDPTAIRAALVGGGNCAGSKWAFANPKQAIAPGRFETACNNHLQ
jgi:hypothetical protein